MPRTIQIRILGPVAACACPAAAGKTFHDQATCSDPEVRAVGWFAFNSATGAGHWPTQLAGLTRCWSCWGLYRRAHWTRVRRG